MCVGGGVRCVCVGGGGGLYMFVACVCGGWGGYERVDVWAGEWAGVRLRGWSWWAGLGEGVQEGTCLVCPWLARPTDVRRTRWDACVTQSM